MATGLHFKTTVNLQQWNAMGYIALERPCWLHSRSTYARSRRLLTETRPFDPKSADEGLYRRVYLAIYFLTYGRS